MALPILRRCLPLALRRWLRAWEPKVRERLHRLHQDGLDLRDRLTGRADPLTPPRTMQAEVGGQYSWIGSYLLTVLREVAGLQPTERVLEVGCGCGRVAVPLTGYLQPPGSYDGFDVMRHHVRWCQRAIAPRFPHFHFQWSNVRNHYYNPQGPVRAAEYTFPYPAGAFDLVFLTSVFTHLLPEDFDRYLGEVARVLRPGGRCLATFFLMNEVARQAIREGRNMFPVHACPGYYAASPQAPELAIILDESWVRERLAAHGLVVQEPIRFGAWSGRHDGTAQDVVVARKR